MEYEHECQTCHNKWKDSKLIERCPKCGASIDGTGIPEEARHISEKK